MQKCRVARSNLPSHGSYDGYDREFNTAKKYSSMSKKAIIIGAGPAGLTAAFELLTRTDIIPIVLEKSGEIGGISKTTSYKGNRMDMGPHRFFSKSDRVMDWWLRIMPLEDNTTKSTISFQNKTRQIQGNYTPKDPTKVMVVIKRLTRIYFLRKFFAYPLQLTWDTLRTLGFERTVLILCSFIWAKIFPRRPEKNLEDFIINRFGRQLYLLFFKDYTEKVWGKAPSQISAEWGAQRIKGVSLSKAIQSALHARSKKNTNAGDLAQKENETSLIEQFLYPKFGTGSLWEEVAREIQAKGGKIYLNQDVRAIEHADGEITAIQTTDTVTGATKTWEGEYFFSTMPVQELIAGMGNTVPPVVREVALGLQYRDFINVGLLLKRFSTKDGRDLKLDDNWIYVQERDVKVGRLMIYNNWGGSMVNDPNTVWIGMEYFCNKTDALWFETDESLQLLAIKELDRMELARPEDILDGTVQRMEKTYPAYFGTYDRFDTIKAFTDQFANLFLVGRNGMHKYNNADHSMLCSMVAVDNIVAGVTGKANLWSINTEQEYHEEKTQGFIPHRTPNAQPFLTNFLWKDTTNRAWWMGSLIVSTVLFFLFKMQYPFVNYMTDSYSYIAAAVTNADVNTWPVGYSKFLRLVSVFTHSDYFLAYIQYFFFQISSLLFVFTLAYFQRSGRLVRNTLLLFVTLNPLPLYLANFVSADAIFTSLSLCWLTTLIWVVYRPKPWMIFIHGILILACYVIRYNAIYYPLVAIAAFLLARWSWPWKLTAIGLAGGLILFSFLYTSREMQRVTGKEQFSAFGGWQLANNALYMYEHVPANERVKVPPEYAKLDKMVREHLDTISKVKRSKRDAIQSFFYLWSEKGPLVQYLMRDFAKDTTLSYFKRWASEGPLYEGYGVYLIQHFPIEYAKNVMLPNAVKFAVPPVEFLGQYNMGLDTVEKLAKDWFQYKSPKVRNNGQPASRVGSVTWYPIFVALSNLLFLLTLVGLVFFKAVRWKSHGFPQLLALVLILWGANCAFSIFAAPIVLRYQMLSAFVCFSIALVSIEILFKPALQNYAHA
jgi:protoporphyrinogen oxidase